MTGGLGASKEKALTSFAKAAERDRGGPGRIEEEEEQTMETLLNLPPPPPQKGSLYAVRRASDIIIFQFVQAVSSVFSLTTEPRDKGHQDIQLFCIM